MPKQEQFGGERQEQRNETPSVSAEQKESPQNDTAYSNYAQNYFNRRRSDWMEGKENPSDEDLKYQKFLDEQRRTLANVANYKLVEKMHPKETTFALSELAGMMANNMEQDPNSTIDQNREYSDAKKIFMTTCQKMFSKVSIETNGATPYFELGKLKKAGIDAGEMTSQEGENLLRDNPKELAKRIDAILAVSGDTMKQLSFESFCSEDPKNIEAEKLKLSPAVISVYRLQIMRDKLTKQIYGREDITPSEQREMDEARNTAMGDKKTTPEKPKTAPTYKTYKYGGVEPTKRQPQQEAPRQRTENREADAEKLENEMVKRVFEESGVLLHSSFRFKVEGSNHTGLQDLAGTYKSRPNFKAFDVGNASAQLSESGRPDTAESILKEHGMKEIIDIRHEQVAEYESVTIPGKKGFMGIGSTPDKTKRELSGYKQVNHSEVMPAGKQEPAVRFTYLAYGGYDWTDGNRPGKPLQATFILPESTAKQLTELIDKNPLLVRKIAQEALMRSVGQDKIDYWKKQGDNILPPYDEWDSKPGGGKIYVQKEGGPQGWHEENVRKVKK